MSSVTSRMRSRRCGSVRRDAALIDSTLLTLGTLRGDRDHQDVRTTIAWPRAAAPPAPTGSGRGHSRSYKNVRIVPGQVLSSATGTAWAARRAYLGRTYRPADGRHHR